MNKNHELEHDRATSGNPAPPHYYYYYYYQHLGLRVLWSVSGAFWSVLGCNDSYFRKTLSGHLGDSLGNSFLLQDRVHDGSGSHVFSLGSAIHAPCSDLSPDSGCAACACIPAVL